VLPGSFGPVPRQRGVRRPHVILAPRCAPLPVSVFDERNELVLKNSVVVVEHHEGRTHGRTIMAAVPLSVVEELTIEAAALRAVLSTVECFGIGPGRYYYLELCTCT
jgi:hypothetical protein